MATSVPPSQDYVMVVAIDVASSESCFAFSFKSKPNDVKTSKDWASDPEECRVTDSNPTSLLVKPDGSFDSFGFKAETRYNEFKAEGNVGGPDGYNLYSDFVMVLGRPDATLSSTLVSRDGHIMKALDIFVMVLHCIKRCVLDATTSFTVRKSLDPLHLGWVLTIPDIWREESKVLLKEAAAKAGLPSAQVFLKPTSEAVLNYFQHEFLNSRWEMQSVSFQPGDRILIIVAQANETTFSSYEIQRMFEVKRLLPAKQIHHGLRSVTRSFVKLMTKIFGTACINSFNSTHPQCWEFILREFETRLYDNFDRKQSLNLSLPYTFGLEVLKVRKMEVSQLIGLYKNGISFCNGALQIGYYALMALFADVVSNIIQEVQELLHRHELQKLQYIGLAGSFMHCSILQGALQDAFTGSKTILIPKDPKYAIRIGAVQCGHKQ